MMTVGAIDLPMATIAELCRRYGVKELAVFGSVLRGDFRTDSDIDLLVEFEPTARIGFVKYLKLQDDLSALLRRKVDLVEAQGVKPRFKAAVLADARVIYAN